MAPKKKDVAWKAAKPHTFTSCADGKGLVACLRTNAIEARKYLDKKLVKIDGDTGMDDFFLSMFRKLQGKIERVRDTPVKGLIGNASFASMFKLGRKLGRPCRETAIADAAAALVGQKWRQYKLSQAKKQRRPSEHATAKAARPRIGTFTQRGNAITGVKSAAIVQVSKSDRYIRL